MDENNIPPQAFGNPPQGNSPFGGKEQKPSNIKIVGYNLLVLIIYTIICKVIPDDGGVIFDMFFIGIHVVVAIVLAIVNRSWMWLLSALLVLIIGFSTCVAMVNFNGH